MPDDRPSTVRIKETALQLHLLPRLGAFRVDDITTQEIDALSAELSEKGLSPKTRANILAILRTSLRKAVEWNLIRSAPCFPKVSLSKPKLRFLTEAEELALLGAAPDGFWRTLLLFLVHTGTRFSEAAALHWSEVHSEEVIPYVTISHGGWRGIRGPTKTGEPRSVPLSPALLEALRTLPRTNDHVFPQAHGRVMMNAASESKYIYKFCDMAGIRRCAFHALRHTFGTRMAAAGVPVPVLQQWMGHTSIKTTMRYVHVDEATALAFAPAIQRALPVPWAPSPRVPPKVLTDG
jgi:integrase